MNTAAVVLLIAAACLAYCNAGHEEFFFDSAANNFINNPRTMDLPGAFRGLWRNPFAADEQLARLTFALNCALNRAVGLPPFDVTAFLVFNVAVHALNVCLVYFLLRSLLAAIDSRRPTPMLLPLALSLLFAVHPIHASSVVYIAQRRGLLATTFYLLAVLAYLHVRRGTTVESTAGSARRESPARKSPVRESCLPLTERSEVKGLAPSPAGIPSRVLALVAILICYWLGYRAKSMALTLPAIILMLEFCLRAADRESLRRYLRYLVPGLALCAAGGVLFLWRRGLFDLADLQIKGYGPRGLHGAWTHFLTESRVFVHYWKLLFLPLPQWLCIDHIFTLSTTLLDKSALLALAFHAGMCALAIVAAFRRWTLAAIGILWFYLTLLPYALVPQADLLVEYKTYLASVGLVLLLAELLRRLPRLLLGRAGYARHALAVVVGVALLVTTLSRNSVYRDPLTLWQDAVEKYPNHPRPRNNLAAYLVERKRFDEAIAHCKAAMKAAPDFVDAYVTLGTAYSGAGRVDEAIAEYREALRLNPASVEVHYNLGNMLLKKKLYSDAIIEYEAARTLNPHYIKSYIMCAEALHAQGRFDEAVALLRAGIQAAQPNEDPPDLVRAHFNLANTLALKNDFAAAIDEYHAALAINPKYANAHYGLGFVYELQGRPAEAVEEYVAALAINPKYSEARAALDAVQQNPNRLKQE